MSSDSYTVSAVHQQPPDLAQGPTPVQPAQHVPPVQQPQPMMVPVAASKQFQPMMVPVAGGPPMYYSVVAPGIPPMMPAVNYAPQAGSVQFVAAPPQPPPYAVQQPSLSHVTPNDYFPMVLVITIICGVLQVTSLLLGTPAVFCALQAAEAKRAYNFSKTKTMGFIALVLTVSNVLYTIVSIALIVGLSVGLSYPYYYY